MDDQHQPATSTGKRRRSKLAGLLATSALAACAVAIAVPGEEPTEAERAERKLEDDYVERFERAQRLMGSGSDAEAERILRELIAERGEQASVHHALGLLLQFRSRPGEASKALVTAATLAPEDPVVQRDAGLHLLGAGEAKRALAYLAVAARLAPDDVEAAVGEGTALRALGRTGEAAAAFRRALASQAQSVDALTGLAACLVAAKPAEALELVETIPGQWADVFLVRGMALTLLERYDAAVPQLERVLVLVPPGRAGIPFVGSAAESLILCGATEPAAKAAAKWVELETAAGAPSDAAVFALAVARAARKDWDGALAALASVAKPKDEPAGRRAPLRLLEAAVHIRAGRAANAAPVLGSLADIDIDVFERAAARRLVGTLAAAEFERLAAEPGRANDVAFVEALAAELAGDAGAAQKLRTKSASISKPRGEFPGLLVLESAPR